MIFIKTSKVLFIILQIQHNFTPKFLQHQEEKLIKLYFFFSYSFNSIAQFCAEHTQNSIEIKSIGA